MFSVPNTLSIGAVVSLYNAGQAIGGMTVGYLADKISRKYTIGVAALLSMLYDSSWLYGWL